jgi:hypothetical protein
MKPSDAKATGTDAGPVGTKSGRGVAGDQKFEDRRGILGPYVPGTVKSPRGYVFRIPTNTYPNEDRIQIIQRPKRITLSGVTNVNTCGALTSDPFTGREVAALVNTYLWPLYLEKVVEKKSVRLTPTALTVTGSLSNYLHTAIYATLMLENAYAMLFITGYNTMGAGLASWIGTYKSRMERQARDLATIPVLPGLIERYRPWFTPLIRSNGGPVLVDWPQIYANCTLATSSGAVAYNHFTFTDVTHPIYDTTQFGLLLTNIDYAIQYLRSRDTGSVNNDAVDTTAIREFFIWLGYPGIKPVLGPPKFDDFMYDRRMKYGMALPKLDDSLSADAIMPYPLITAYNSSFMQIGNVKTLDSDFNGVGPAMCAYNPTPTDKKVIIYGDVVPENGSTSTNKNAWEIAIVYTKEDGWLSQSNFVDWEDAAVLSAAMLNNVLTSKANFKNALQSSEDMRMISAYHHDFCFMLDFDRFADEHWAELCKLLDVPDLLS